MDGHIFKKFFFSLFILLTGCAAHISTHYTGEIHCDGCVKPKPLKVHKTIFSYSKTPLKLQETPYNKKYEYYDVSLLKFPSVGENGQPNNEVKAMYFRSKLPGRHKLLIVLPIFIGSQYPPRAITDTTFRCSRGDVSVLRILADNPLFDLTDLENAKDEKEFRHMLKVLAKRTKSTIIDTQKLIDWALAQGNVLPNDVTIVGFSKASVIAALIAQINSKITGAILVVGASDPGDLLFHCNYYQIREKITQRFHWTDKKLKEVIHTYLTDNYNVAHYPTRLDPSHVLIIDALYDKCVPKYLRDSLWTAMGKPERISLYYNHIMAFGSMTFAGGYYMRHKILGFISNNCALPESMK